MGTYVQVCLVGLIYCITMLTLEVWAGFLEGLYKDLLQLGQPLSPAWDALSKLSRKTSNLEFNVHATVAVACQPRSRQAQVMVLTTILRASFAEYPVVF